MTNAEESPQTRAVFDVGTQAAIEIPARAYVRRVREDAVQEVSVKRNLTLVIMSLLSILLMTVHLTQDTLYARVGTPESKGATLVVVPILVVWLYGTLVRPERRSGVLIMLVGSLLALSMPLFHMMGPVGVLSRPARVFGDQMARSGGAFLFYWVLMALGVTGMFSLHLAVRGLWEMRSRDR